MGLLYNKINKYLTIDVGYTSSLLLIAYINPPTNMYHIASQVIGIYRYLYLNSQTIISNTRLLFLNS